MSLKKFIAEVETQHFMKEELAQELREVTEAPMDEEPQYEPAEWKALNDVRVAVCK